MNEKRARRKLSGILSADVVGYSRLMEEDEASTILALENRKELMTNLIQKYRGRVVDAPGDNLLAEFGSVVDATECTIKIQQEFKTKNEELPEKLRMKFRMGINLGDIIEEGDKIYGDGVNIAARVEKMAEDGGICISGTVYDQIENKLSIKYESLGEHRVKNITKPIRVYRIVMEPSEKRFPEKRKLSLTRESFSLPGKVSIAILPFDNLSGDPEQEYLADGMTENIIAVLSTVPAMFVIARNSAFTYKGKPVKVQEVAEDLGVHYVLEGSIQKAGARVRVIAQLIDAIKGHHLWADRYDRDFQDVFVLQDEITLKIITALQVKLTHGQLAYMNETTNNLEAWEYFVKGIDFFEHFTKEDNVKAQEFFERAVALDPQYAAAWTMLGWTYWIDASYGFSQSRSECFNRSVELAHKALDLDDSNPDVHALLGGIHLFRGQHDQAISEGQRAIALQPNDACNIAILAQTMSYAGRSEEAIALMKKAMLLNPYYPDWYLGILSRSYYVAGQYEEAIVTYNELHERRQRGSSNSLLISLGLALAYIRTGKEEEARNYAKEVMKIDPNFSLVWMRKATFFKDQTFLEKDIEALHNVGLPY